MASLADQNERAHGSFDRGATVAFPRTSIRGLYESSKVMLRRARCSDTEREWAKSMLLPREFALWSQMGDYDQAHSIYVAREAHRRLSQDSLRDKSVWIAAALLHDVGKMAANLSPPERVVGTLIGKYVPFDLGQRFRGSSSKKARRIGMFLMHGEVGAGLVREAGGREIVAYWCDFHQNVDFPADFAIPGEVVRALVAAEEY